jgi:transposase
MVLIPLLPYSPELNPVEHIWDYLRDALGNKTFNSLDEVVDLLCTTTFYVELNIRNVM